MLGSPATAKNAEETLIHESYPTILSILFPCRVEVKSKSRPLKVVVVAIPIESPYLKSS